MGDVQIIRNEGFARLYRGVSAQSKRSSHSYGGFQCSNHSFGVVLGAIPSHAIYFAVYEVSLYVIDLTMGRILMLDRGDLVLQGEIGSQQEGISYWSDGPKWG